MVSKVLDSGASLGLGVLGSGFRARFSQFICPLWARM